ncbi:hypothetical protein C9374_007771 [Naegleria lovaniensis]|uniref:Uncharacterized protein n=1 Tax=Naegleria lovaniensis TaxID=51637 RepID=A0AA88GMR2_NAELO|nr:uncharacterized protein C9374_007771 [Naegleria lovaniensis]KAG2379133.1 hypothetical protein C9374_007771 [Naegleria lovaniensis]
MSASDDPKSFDLKHSKDVVTTNIHDIKVEKSNLETSSEIATTNNTNNNSNLNSRTIVTISQEEELLTLNHASASTTENSLQPQQLHQDDDNNFNSMNSGNIENHRLSTESNTTTSSTHSKASNSGSDISKRPIAPWQEELLSKYKNDGKFKFVTQTAEQKLSTITTTQQQASSPEQHATSSMSTLGSSSLTPTTERIAKISPGVHHKESVRVSADFHNFLNKFKTIEQKTKEEPQVLTSPRGHHFSSSTSRDTKSEHHSDQQQQ